MNKSTQYVISNAVQHNCIYTGIMSNEGTQLFALSQAWKQPVSYNWWQNLPIYNTF